MLHRLPGTIVAVVLVLAAAATAHAAIPMRVEASAQTVDGKIVVAGRTTPTTSPLSITLARFNADGTPDPSFAGGSFQYLAMEALAEFRVTALTLTPDGKPLVATVFDGKVALVRFNPDGGIDTSFGNSGPGLAIDNNSAGHRVNALVAQDDNIFGVGAYSGPETAGAWTSMVVRYYAHGFRDMGYFTGPAGIQLLSPSPGENELRAAVRLPSGGFYAAGYARDAGGEKDFLFAGFTPYGHPNGAFAPNGTVTFQAGPGYDDEASAITLEPGGSIVAVGRDGYRIGGQSRSNFVYVRMTPYGIPDDYTQPLYSAGYREIYFPDWERSDAWASFVAIVPGTADLLIGGTVMRPSTGATHFALVRFWGTPPPPGPDVNPINPELGGDDVLQAAYPNGNGQVIAVGTREALTGDAHEARVARYFAATLAFETDFTTPADDTTPNALEFEAGSAQPPFAYWYSQAIAVTGISVAVPITIQNGAYSVGCTGSFVNTPGTVVNGDVLCLRLITAETPYTTVTATVDIGTLSTPVRVTTGGVPDTLLGSVPSNPSLSTVQFTLATSVFEAAGGFGAELRCSLDGAPFSPCNETLTFQGLVPGAHTFRAIAGNAWGFDPTPASYTWTVGAPPETTLTSAPPSTTNQTSAIFEFTSPDAAATFECALWSSGTLFWAPCTSPESYPSLSPGTRTFIARAVNTFGKDPTPAEYVWTIDTAAPAVTITSGPPPTSGSTATFEFSSTESPVTFRCRMDAEPPAACSSGWQRSGVPAGAHTFAVEATDAAGNVSTAALWSWTVDATPPETYITSQPSAATSSQAPTFTFTSNEAGVTFECKLDDEPAFTACTSPKSYSGLPEGGHAFRVRAIDAVGQADPQPAQYDWTIDLTTPDTLITSAPDPLSSIPAATFAFSSSEPGATFECRLDGGAFSPCASPKSYSGLADGAHAFEVRALDLAQNPDGSPSVFSWTIDTVAADTTIGSGPSGTVAQASATITFSSPQSGVTFQCRLDSAAFAACASPASLTGLADGAHTFEVRSKDAAGNVDLTPASLTWTVDTTGPETSITAGPAAATSSTSASFSFSATGSAVSYQCRRDGGSWGACTSPKSYTGLTQGAHVFEVRGRDALNNVDPTPATWNWTVDTNAPNTTINSGPSGTVTSTTATFTFSSNESSPAFECQLDSAPYAACTSPKTYSGLPSGNRAFRVRAKDAAGNVDATPATRSWRIN